MPPSTAANHPSTNTQKNLNTQTVTTSSDVASPVHPIELTVQSLIESPLEILNLNLNSLYESQLILSTILKNMEGKLAKTLRNVAGPTRYNSLPNGTASEEGGGEEHAGSGNEHVNWDDAEEEDAVSVEDYLRRIVVVKERLEGINATLDKVENRVDKIMANMGLN